MLNQVRSASDAIRQIEERDATVLRKRCVQWRHPRSRRSSLVVEQVMHTRRKTDRAPRVRQLSLLRHGGARRGAGRKPNGVRARVSHRSRGVLAARFPVLVTLKVASGQPSLRRAHARELVFAALAAARERHGMRVVHFSVQANHLHALVEASDARALARGMQGLAVRIARALNRLWGRSGRLWCDRFHSRVLRTPREARNALVYVLHNAR